ncbi:hypothetical protein ACFX2F_046423 [Malus domestica]
MAATSKKRKFVADGVLFAEPNERKSTTEGSVPLLRQSLGYKLLGGFAVRRTCYGVCRFVMESGAKGCERAKSMKFKDGYMISSGQPVKEYIDAAVPHVLLRQGVLGIKVKITLDWDPKGKQGSKTPPPYLIWSPSTNPKRTTSDQAPSCGNRKSEIPVGLVAA